MRDVRDKTWPWKASTIFLLCCVVAGCAGPGPRLFPSDPISQQRRVDGVVEVFYDTDRDGDADYSEIIGHQGMVESLRNELGAEDQAPANPLPSPAQLQDQVRHLVIILDSIPFDMVREFYGRGHFRHFHPPSRVISPFPVMTDLSLSEFFGTSPSRSMEARFYDGRGVNLGYGTYVREENSSWLQELDYYLSFNAHGSVYLDPHPWFDHELRHIQDQFLKEDGPLFIGYSVGTSALGAKYGADGHRAALEELDRFCRWIIHHLRGRVHITLLSDHGHDMTPSRWVDLNHELRQKGYSVRTRLRNPKDVILPAFGMVSCAAVHCLDPAAVAADLVDVEGVGLVFYRDGQGGTTVLSRDGRARIVVQGDRYAYRSANGDPLRLKEAFAELTERGQVDAEGFVEDRALFEATADHAFPDSLHRLYRATNGLIEHAPDVYVSLMPGYYTAAKSMKRLMRLRASHGSLDAISSSGFVLTTAGAVDKAMRMEDLRGVLRAVGVPFAD